MKATTLLLLVPLLLAGLAPAPAAQGGSAHQRNLPAKTSVVYGSAERTRLLDQLHGQHKGTSVDPLGSVARRAALTQKRYRGEKRISAQRTRR